jgi:hypothetical protein
MIQLKIFINIKIHLKIKNISNFVETKIPNVKD